MTDQDLSALLATITAFERKVWDALVTGDSQADQRLLSDAFLGVYSDGFATKHDHSGQLEHGPTVQSYDLQDIKVRPLGAGHALISYRAIFLRTGHHSTPEVMFVSSIWQQDGENWINIFSQDTPLVDAPA